MHRSKARYEFFGPAPRWTFEATAGASAFSEKEIEMNVGSDFICRRVLRIDHVVAGGRLGATVAVA